jgi:hypothetical protein
LHGGTQATNILVRPGSLDYLALVERGGCGWGDPALDFLGMPPLFHNAEAEVCQWPRFRNAYLLQVDRLDAWAQEEPDAVTEQDGHEVDEDLIEEPLSGYTAGG